MADKLLLTRSTVPCLFDADLSPVPEAYLISGIGAFNDLELQKISTSPNDPGHWFPCLNGGDYFIGTDRFLLPSRSAAFLVPRSASGNTVTLPTPPLAGKPISVVNWACTFSQLL